MQPIPNTENLILFSKRSINIIANLRNEEEWTLFHISPIEIVGKFQIY